MREILFRGLRTDGRGWVKGFYTESFDGRTFIQGFKNAKNETFEVIPETVGQFTGLVDVNGTKIFEGDKVKYKPRFYEDNYFDGIIEWWSGQMGIGWRYRSHRFTMMMKRGNILNMEVIGNIHEKKGNDNNWRNKG